MITTCLIVGRAAAMHFSRDIFVNLENVGIDVIVLNAEIERYHRPIEPLDFVLDTREENARAKRQGDRSWVKHTRHPTSPRKR